MAEKRYYWLKLHDDFFKSKEIKKLRKMAGGDTYTIIYLKMLLSTMNTDGLLVWQGIEDSLDEEIALDIDEKVEDVKMTALYLQSKGLLEILDETRAFLPEVIINTGSETGAASRMRKMRAKTREELQERNIVTPMLRDCYIEKEIKKENTPHTPQGSGRVNRETLSEPKWKPERFNGFWQFYPRHENKRAAIRAWDRLKPSDELIAQIAMALQRQCTSDMWTRGVGIPYAAAYLNQGRWEDEPDPVTDPASTEEEIPWL